VFRESTHELPPVPRPRRLGRAAARVFFGCWTAGVVGGVALLSRDGGELQVAHRQSAAAQALTAGWHLRHWLPANHALTPLIARQLLARGPLAAVKEEVYLVGQAERLADRLRAAGWTVQLAEIGAEPRIEIFAPDQTLRWSGRFGDAALGVSGAVVLDTVVLEKVSRGEPVAPFVPVGCVSRLAAERRFAWVEGAQNSSRW